MFILISGNISFAEYWPTEEWQTSLPEKHGMSSDQLKQINEHVKEKLPDTTSVLVVRNGYIVFEEYYSREKGDLRALDTATKSITSALIGIAIQENYIAGVDEKMISFFPEFDTKALDKVKKFFKDCDIARFTPYEQAKKDMSRLFKEAEEIIKIFRKV